MAPGLEQVSGRGTASRTFAGLDLRSIDARGTIWLAPKPARPCSAPWSDFRGCNLAGANFGGQIYPTPSLTARIYAIVVHCRCRRGQLRRGLMNQPISGASVTVMFCDPRTDGAIAPPDSTVTLHLPVCCWRISLPCNKHVCGLSASTFHSHAEQSFTRLFSL